MEKELHAVIIWQNRPRVKMMYFLFGFEVDSFSCLDFKMRSIPNELISLDFGNKIQLFQFILIYFSPQTSQNPIFHWCGN